MGKSGFRKTKHGFAYHGSLEECLVLAKKQLKKLEEDEKFERRLYDLADKRFSNFCNLIASKRDFIAIAERQIMENKNGDV